MPLDLSTYIEPQANFILGSIVFKGDKNNTKQLLLRS